MSHFYRYLHPLEFNINRLAVQTSTKGGICFRCEVDDGVEFNYKLVTVAASICGDDDLFNKEVAKKIADQRFLYGSCYTIHSASLATNIIALAIVELSENVQTHPGAPKDVYLHHDLHHLASKIKAIRNTHRAAWEMEKMGSEIVGALNLRNYYAKLQGR